MKNSRTVKAVIAILILSLTMSMAVACGSDSTSDNCTDISYDSSTDTGNGSYEYDSNSPAEDGSVDTVDTNEGDSNYYYEDNCSYSYSDPCSYEEIEEFGYDAYEGPEAYDNYDYEDSESDNDYDDNEGASCEQEYSDNTGTEECESGDAEDESDDSSSYGISDETDFAKDAPVRTGEFEFKALPAVIGATNASLKARVINRTGKAVTGFGCSLYYTYGGLIKSTLIRNDCDYDEFDITLDINEHLDEILERGLIYDYKIFVECDGKIYTHDAIRFETNDVDDNISISAETVSVDKTAANIKARIYNPTGARIEAVGCRYGSGTFMIDEDKQVSERSDSEFEVDFTLHSNEGGFLSGDKYEYIIYVICEGKEYSIGEYRFTAPV